MTMILLPNRGVLRVSGPDRVQFLQGLVSNDVRAVAPGRAVYACLLTPQGKFLHDFFLIADGESLLLDCEADRREDLARRLKTFRLRSKVEIADVDGFDVFAILDGGAPPGVIVFADPRISALGKRVLVSAVPELHSDASAQSPPPNLPHQGGGTRSEALPLEGGGLGGGGTGPSEACEAYDRLRMSLAAPDGSRDMEVGKAILLENNIDQLNGIAWDKGCYMGQELTARTRYRGLIKKRLVPVAIEGDAPPVGTPLIENGVEVGEMRGAAGDLGLALLKLDILRQGRPVIVDGAVLTPRAPDYLAPLLETPDA